MTRWNTPPRLGLVVTYAPLEVGWESAPALLENARKALGQLSLELEVAPAPVFDVASALDAAEAMSEARVEAVIWIAATWAFDSLALDFLRTCSVPLVAWGLPGVQTGSLCGSQQLAELLHEVGHPCLFVHGELADPSIHQRITAFAHASAAAQRLKRARFGMLGHRTIGMTEVTFHELDLFQQFGSIVYFRGHDQLREAMANVEAAQASGWWEGIKGQCGACHASEVAGIEAGRCYHAMKAWIAADQLAGIAVGCYPDMMGVPCLACGALAEEGLVTSCEGDMNSLILTAAMQLASGRPVHNTDILSAEADTNSGIFSHCGNSALSLASSSDAIAIEAVRLMDRGAVAQYTGAPGRVTLANLCGRAGTYRLACYTGEAIATEMVFPGIPLRIRLDVPMAQFLEETAKFGAGHHWMVAYGDIRPALADFAKLTRLKEIERYGATPSQTIT